MPEPIQGETTPEAQQGGQPPPHQNGAAGAATPEPPETLRALQTEREARAAAERAAATLRTEREAEQKKWAEERETLTKAVSEANTKATTTEVKRVLGAAGCIDVDLAALAGEFAGVDPAKIPDAVKKFQEAHPSLFPKAPTSPHSFDGGAQPGQNPGQRTMNDVIRRAAGKTAI